MVSLTLKDEQLKQPTQFQFSEFNFFATKLFNYKVVMFSYMQPLYNHFKLKTPINQKTNKRTY